ncbi:MAG: wcaJ [Rhizobacter sp.]|nr:wcaJ [Rhizobacter sp.]
MASIDLIDRSRRSDARPASEGWNPFAAGIRGEGTAARRAWQSSYVRRTVLLDVLCGVVAAAAGYALWFGWAAASAPRPPVWIAVFLPLVWLPALLVALT